MEMTGEQLIPASIEAVWHALNDPDVLRASIPGCQSLEPIGDDGFKAAATIKVGPISARFGGVVQLSERDPPHSYRISGEGSGGAAGAAKGTAQVRLTEDGDATLLTYNVSADVSGRLAQLGGKVIDMTARQLAGVFFARFSQEVLRREGAKKEAAADAPRPEPRSQSVAVLAGPASAALAPRSAAASGWLFAVAAALVGGFVLGRMAGGWDGSGALAGAAVSLLIVLVAAAAFLLGQRPAGASSATVSLDADSIARLAAAIERQPR